MKIVLPLLIAAVLASCTLHVYVHEGLTDPISIADAGPDLSGSWKVQGEDLVPWSATLVLNDETHQGHFDWRSNAGSGRELVTWQYDQGTGTLHLAGYDIEDPTGSIGCGTYEILVAYEGDRLVNGTWGPPAMPGTWEATR